MAGLACLLACGDRPRSGGPPRLVVVVVLDQLGSWVLEDHLPSLRPDGAIRRAIRKGAYHARVVYDYAATNTAPGHAAIFTGASPGESGVVANRLWDPQRDRLVNVVDDGRSPV